MTTHIHGGTITPTKDTLGIPRFKTVSTLEAKEALFYTMSAALYYLEMIAACVEARAYREGRGK